MNYFGHAAIAAARLDDAPADFRQDADWTAAAFVFGAMLPDLSNMVGLRPPVPSAATVARGVELHHQTDAVFHHVPDFVDTNVKACARLRELGVRRGPARAVAHIGIEMLIDAGLARDARRGDIYLQALGWGGTPRRGLGWGVTAALEVAGLATHLRDRGLGVHQSHPERITKRLRRALEGRPRLSLTAAEEVVVRRWVEETAPTVIRQAESIFSTVLRCLSNPPAPTSSPST